MDCQADAPGNWSDGNLSAPSNIRQALDGFRLAECRPVAGLACNAWLLAVRRADPLPACLIFAGALAPDIWPERAI